VEIAFRGTGPFLWAKLPTSLDAPGVLRLAKSQGIVLAPGDMFRPDGRHTGHYRLNVAFAGDELLQSFVEKLPR
jgi:DNA-binding transcriptional MocR family regulator